MHHGTRGRIEQQRIVGQVIRYQQPVGTTRRPRGNPQSRRVRDRLSPGHGRLEHGLLLAACERLQGHRQQPLRRQLALGHAVHRDRIAGLVRFAALGSRQRRQRRIQVLAVTAPCQPLVERLVRHSRLRTAVRKVHLPARSQIHHQHRLVIV